MDLLVVAILVASMWGQGQGQGQGQGHGHDEVAVVLQAERELLDLNLNLDPLSLGGGVTDLCGRADYPSLCRSVVKGLTNPSAAMESAIRQLMAQTKLARRNAKKKRNSSEEMDVCYENYDDAYTNLETCIENLEGRDEASLNINLSAALTDYVTCDDTLSQGGLSSPVTRINLTLRQMASNCLYLSSLIRLH